MLRLILRFGIATILITATAAAQQPHGSLTLHKVRHALDENGQVWLTVQFVNHGGNTINVAGVAPTRWGPWYKVAQKVEPETPVRGMIKIVKDEPSAVWVDSSEGLTVFQLPAR